MPASKDSYADTLVISRPDGRSRSARLLKRTREVYAAYLGGPDKLTPGQEALLVRVAMLQLKVAEMDRKLLDNEFSEKDVSIYIRFSNALVAALRELGVTPTAEKPQTDDPMNKLRDHFASRAQAATS